MEHIQTTVSSVSKQDTNNVVFYLIFFFKVASNPYKNSSCNICPTPPPKKKLNFTHIISAYMSEITKIAKHVCKKKS